MNNRFMRIKRIMIPAVSLILMTATLTGCTTATTKELVNMLASGEQIEMEVVVPNNSTVLADNSEAWTALASLTDQEDIRKAMDDQLMIFSFGNNSKNGVLYVDPETESWQPDNTIENVFKNKAFLEYWADTEKQDAIQEKVKSGYTDLDDSTGVDELKLAALNAYFNLFADNTDGSYNGDSVLTREQFMEGFAKSHFNTQAASEASTVSELGNDENTLYAGLLGDASYLDIKSGSLNKDNYNEPMTRAEAIYIIVKTMYPDEMASVDVKNNYSDVKDGGDIAAEAGTTDQKYYRAANLKYMLENPTKGMDSEMSKALAVAYVHKIAGNEQTSRWNEAITKNEAMNMLLAVYEDKGTLLNCKQGEYNEELVAESEQELEFENVQAKELYDEYGFIPKVSYEEYYEMACKKAEEMGWDVDFTTWTALADVTGYSIGGLVDMWKSDCIAFSIELECAKNDSSWISVVTGKKIEDTPECMKELCSVNLDYSLDEQYKLSKLASLGIDLNRVNTYQDGWYEMAMADYEKANAKPSKSTGNSGSNSSSSNNSGNNTVAEAPSDNTQSSDVSNTGNSSDVAYGDDGGWDSPYEIKWDPDLQGGDWADRPNQIATMDGSANGN